jgi:hypothetical protein
MFPAAAESLRVLSAARRYKNIFTGLDAHSQLQIFAKLLGLPQKTRFSAHPIVPPRTGQVSRSAS